jgi:CRP-like cAMP-binding protein
MSFLDILLQTPVFQGVSKGEQILSVGDSSTHVKFLISGKVMNVTPNKSNSLKIKEIFIAPNVIAGNYVFGLETRSVCDVIAHTEVGIMQILKEHFLELLQKEPIFAINYLNYVSLRSQSYFNTTLSFSTGELKERFAIWVLLLTRNKAEEIVFCIKLDEMAKLLGDSRENLTTVLKELRQVGVLVFSESEIRITDRQGLEDFVNNAD